MIERARAARERQPFPVVDVRPSPLTGWRAIAVGSAVVAIMIVDGTAANAMNAALPYLQAISAATPDEASWILIVFNAAYYSTIVFSPWLYARIGQKMLLRAGLLGFAATSLMLTAAQPLGAVILLRFVQGIALGCVFVPASVLFFTSLPLKLLPFAPPFFATIVLGSGTMGSFIGGYLTENYGGTAVYVPGAIVALACAAVLALAAPASDVPQPRLRPDLIGFTLALVSFGALQFLANEGERRNWLDDGTVGIAFWSLALGAGALVAWEVRFARAPFLNLRLLAQKRNFAVGTLVNVMLGVVGYSVVAFVLYLETYAQATATLAGAMVLLRLSTYVVGIAIGFLLVKRRILGVRAVAGIAAVGSSVALWAFASNMTGVAEAGGFVEVSLLFGLFFSMLSQTVPGLVLGSLGLRDLPGGLSLYKVAAPVGTSVGTAVFQTLLNHRSAAHLSDLLGQLTSWRLPVVRFLAGGGSANALASLASAQAQALAFDDIMRAFALCVLITVPILWAANTRADPAR